MAFTQHKVVILAQVVTILEPESCEGVGTLTFWLPHLSLPQQGLPQEQVPWPSNEIHIGEVILCQVLFIINWWVHLQIFPIIC